jgi:hypothetical protein
MATAIPYRFPSYYRYLFVYGEPLILIISFSIFFAAPDKVSILLFKPFLSVLPASALDDLILNHSITHLLICYFFNMTLIMSGVQYYCVDNNNYQQTRAFLIFLFLGDVGHFLATYRFVFMDNALKAFDLANWELGLWANLGITAFLMFSRLAWFAGIGERNSAIKQLNKAKKAK